MLIEELFAKGIMIIGPAKEDPSGRLACSIPKSLHHSPSFGWPSWRSSGGSPENGPGGTRFPPRVRIRLIRTLAEAAIASAKRVPGCASSDATEKKDHISPSIRSAGNGCTYWLEVPTALC